MRSDADIAVDISGEESRKAVLMVDLRAPEIIGEKGHGGVDVEEFGLTLGGDPEIERVGEEESGALRAIEEYHVDGFGAEIAGGGHGVAAQRGYRLSLIVVKECVDGRLLMYAERSGESPGASGLYRLHGVLALGGAGLLIAAWRGGRGGQLAAYLEGRGPKSHDKGYCRKKSTRYAHMLATCVCRNAKLRKKNHMEQAIWFF